jgi:hypothetical protein
MLLPKKKVSNGAESTDGRTIFVCFCRNGDGGLVKCADATSKSVQFQCRKKNDFSFHINTQSGTIHTDNLHQVNYLIE